MKKRTKQIITAVTAIVLLLYLAACGSKTFTCELCKEEKTGKSYETTVWGEELTICEDCYKELKGVFGN